MIIAHNTLGKKKENTWSFNKFPYKKGFSDKMASLGSNPSCYARPQKQLGHSGRYPLTLLHYMVLHCTALYCTAPHCSALNRTVVHCIALHCTALY